MTSKHGSSSTKPSSVRVAVIGGGVSGLAAAWHLHTNSTNSDDKPNIEVELFESDPRLGGHAHTLTVDFDKGNCREYKNGNDRSSAVDDANAASTGEEESAGEEKKETESETEVAINRNGSTATNNDVNNSIHPNHPPKSNTVDIDVGFMIYNPHNYPNMTRWFQSLHLPPGESTDMSLSISLDDGNTVEWSSHSLSGLFAKPTQMCSPKFYTFLRDMLHFNSHAAEILNLCDAHPQKKVTMGEYLRREGYSEEFANYYLVPMMAALWSASIEDVMKFPAGSLIEFMCNHRMLQLFDRTQYLTPAGRSIQYTQKMASILGKRAHTSTPILSMKKIPGSKDTIGSNSTCSSSCSYELFATNNISVGTFDHVIFACHAPQALKILETMQVDYNHTENHSNNNLTTLLQALSQIRYGSNVVYVHSDPKLMPKRKAAWSSWNCLGKSDLMTTHLHGAVKSGCSKNAFAKKEREAMEGAASGFGGRLTDFSGSTESNGSGDATVDKSNEQKQAAADGGTSTDPTHSSSDLSHLEGENGRMRAVYVTYYLNRLQNLFDKTPIDIFVSLNPHSPPDPSLTYRRQIMAHPQFTMETLRGRAKIRELQGMMHGCEGLWFCGAWMGYGFHEDGCRSGFEVATEINGVPLPWVGDAETGNAGDAKNVNDAAVTTNTTNDGEESNQPKKQLMQLSKQTKPQLMVLPPPDLAKSTTQKNWTFFRSWKHFFTHQLPVYICRAFVTRFLKSAIKRGRLELKLNDGTILEFGDGSYGTSSSNGNHDDLKQPVTARIFDDWFFVKIATEYDLGLARSYMAGYFLVEPLKKKDDYPWTLRSPERSKEVLGELSDRDETNDIIGDPVGLVRLFLLFVYNRDDAVTIGSRSSKQHTYANALQNASGLAISKLGSLWNYLKFKLFMDNSERGGSLKNIHAHYDLSNDLFRTFLDGETLMYSSAIYEAVTAPISLLPLPSSGSPTSVAGPSPGLIFKGTLEQAQWRKLQTLCDRAQIHPHQTLLDIGFGWGGLSIYAAKRYRCRVHGITLSVEQKALAERRVENEGLQDLITFEVVDYRTFARREENHGKFDRVISCEMIEAVGHHHLGEFFWAVERCLKYDGILVMEAITTPESRYETYLRSTDFINTVIFPGGVAPSLHALVDASYEWSTLTLEHIDNIGLHYAETLAEWRRRFNAKEGVVRRLGFDDVFLRVWNYYLTYCEAGFRSQTENCLILVFSRPGNRALIPLSESRSVTQNKSLTKEEVDAWLMD